MGDLIASSIVIFLAINGVLAADFFPNARLGGGKVLGRKMKMNECLRYCNTYTMFCHGMDYNSQSEQCVLHTKTTECRMAIPQAARNWFHYRRTDCGYKYELQTEGDDAAHIIPRRGSAAGLLGGSLKDFAKQGDSHVPRCPTGQYFYQGFHGKLNDPQPQNARPDIKVFHQCLERCRDDPYCLSFDYNYVENTCYHFGFRGRPSVVGLPSENCCYHFDKHCRISGLATPTGNPVPYDLTRIPDSGYCPDKFHKIVNTLQRDGVLLPGVTTAENCKRECLNKDMVAMGCVATDFNKDTNECFYHTSINPNLIEENQECCDHFRRTTCIEKACYQQSTIGTDRTTRPASFKPLNVLLGSPVPSLTTAPCPNTMCFLNYKLDTSGGSFVEDIVRGCEPCGDSNPATFGCRKTQTATELQYHCVCEGHRCNSFDMNTFRERFGYYPLDGHAQDQSGLYRHAEEVNMKYDTIDVKKNRSAIFDGTAYLNIKSFSGIQFSKVQDNGDTIPGLTIALWVKRAEATGGSMTILSNGPRGYAPIEVRSNEVTPADPTLHEVEAYIRAGGKNFTVKANARVDTWVFLVLQLRADTVTSMLSARLYLTEGATMNAAPDDMDSQAIDNIDRTRVTLSPMCFGKQLVSTSPATANPGFFFNGRMDEIHIFTDGGVPSDALQSIIDQTKPFP